ncbi:MAG: ligase-associated DNA damage response endonuclease PdeM [Rhodospirillaceae bacterium]|nr:ligase-associated DNA damage response endonuclease PdeM [Rhodospirillaceae bacterium]
MAAAPATHSERPGRQSAAVTLGGEPALLDGSGALVLPERRTVVFADLHFEKGSAYAERGALLPPWDSAATLERMEAVLACHTPDRVVCLGDSFHDTGGGGRMAGPLAGRLRRLADRHDWIWIAGNHDPEIPEAAGGRAADRFRLGGLLFLHEPDEREREEGSGDPQICGHFHPKARIRAGPRRITRPCFVGDGRLLILPSFGAYTGGLDIMNPAIAGLFPGDFTAWLISNGAVYAFPSNRTRFLPFEG